MVLLTVIIVAKAIKPQIHLPKVSDELSKLRAEASDIIPGIVINRNVSLIIGG